MKVISIKYIKEKILFKYFLWGFDILKIFINKNKINLFIKLIKIRKINKLYIQNR